MIGDDASNLYQLQRTILLTSDHAQPFRAKARFFFDPKAQCIDFARTVQVMCEQWPHLHHLLTNAQLFYLDERKKTKHFLGEYPLEDSRIFYDDWAGSSIVISYRKHEGDDRPQAKAQQGRKSRERTIKEVRAEIERWRQVAQQNRQGPKGISLISAARSIGMSKKSLDDYLRHLKIGQRLNFDFDSFEGEKMGFLRAFVRSKMREPLEEAKIMNEIDSYWDSTYVGKD